MAGIGRNNRNSFFRGKNDGIEGEEEDLQQ
jgi:hypothetical protein